MDLPGGINAEAPEDRRGEIPRRDRIGHGMGTDPVALPVDRPPLDPAAGEEHRIAVGPVVAAGPGIDLRRPPELPHRHDERRFEEAALVEIGDQRGERPIGDREEMMLVLARALGVSIPVLPLLAVVVDIHERHPCLDEPPGHEEILAAHLSCHPHLAAAAIDLAGGERVGSEAVGLADRGRFLGDIERVADRLRFEEATGPIGERSKGIGPGHGHGRGIEGREEAQAACAAAGIGALPRQEGVDGIRPRHRIDVDEERIVRGPEEAGPLTRDRMDIAEHMRQRRKGHLTDRSRIEGRNDASMGGIELPRRHEQLSIRALEGPASEGMDRSRIVEIRLVVHAPHERDLVHHPGQPREVLADLHAGHRGGDRGKLAADVGRRRRLHVEGIEMTRTAVPEEEDAGADGTGHRHLRPGATGPEKTAERQAQAPTDPGANGKIEKRTSRSAGLAEASSRFSHILSSLESGQRRSMAAESPAGRGTWSGEVR